ncbi:MAG: hypothetical protein CV087_14395 [Candidatus Brocadia sp. WS118]|nr:MAG: hypothetical protein CV087_14395 [Candidatus Brocadia sp. WS118]
MKLRNTKIEGKKGFTILEVMVALAIVGISIGIFFSLIGNSARLREKIDRHAELLLLARTKTEEALLGILGKKHEKRDKEKTFEGVTKDGVQWKVSEVNKYKEAVDKIDFSKEVADEGSIEVPPKGTTLLSTLVGGIRIETIFFSQESDAFSESSEREVREEEEDTVE